MLTCKRTSIPPGLDTTGDGIADAWALQYFGTININPNADPDHDGMSNLEEYLAGTNPNIPDDVFSITNITYGTVTPNHTTLEWTSKPSRAYAVQYRATLDMVPPGRTRPTMAWERAVRPSTPDTPTDV